jgi:hypothetical protein
MVTTILSDEVINSTELRTNQKKWLEKAFFSPISIMSGAKKLVLLNREHAKHMYSQIHFAEMIIRYCEERDSGKKRQSDIFSWIRYLNEKSIDEFHKELIFAFLKAVDNKDWLAFEEMLNAWIATAEAMTNPEMVELINTDLTKEEFTRVE